ncbi:MAG TPA: glycosyl hydrolase family 8 [Candidatus Didemnitutus sp.]|nr:glycosyl hydrolase family 8 [Candidatus Didemnitutus sp.]
MVRAAQSVLVLAVAAALGGTFSGCTSKPAVVPRSSARNLFHEQLNRSEAETDARIAVAWQQLFYGRDADQRVYYPVGADEAYIADVASHDVRTEGLSYGMMIAVQLDHRAEFDRIWKWARTHHYHATGALRGYFAWHADFSGRILDPGPAPDGEEWFVTALFFAAHRWGRGAGIFDYEAEAQGLLHTMLHKSEEPQADGVTSIFDRTEAQIVFAPGAEAAHFTDPSYHLPAFYEFWARWAASPDDRAFCVRAALASRQLFRKAANPVTGLMPDYSEFDGRPHVRHGHEDFRFDAWRTLSNPALDYAWNHSDSWEVEQSDRVLRFLTAQGSPLPNTYRLDGTPLDKTESAGLYAMAATAGLASNPELARPFVQKLWDMPIPDGKYRYYDGMLYLLALLEVGGRFHAYAPVR